MEKALRGVGIKRTIVPVGCRAVTAIVLLACALAAGGLELPETGIDYEIEVTLDPESRRLDGRETIRWTNPGSGPVDVLPLHLYLNGFSHEQTTWARSAPRGFVDIDALLERHDDPWGWIEPSAIQREGHDLDWRPIAPDDGNPNDRSLIEVALVRPIAPGETIEIEIEFEARLPVPIARTGGRDDYFFVGQWFPKVATYESAGVGGAIEDGFTAHQFHGPTEFYADFADFDVRIGVPAGWAVASTGKGGSEPGAAAGGMAWHRYRQRAVHDFAWATGARMVDVVSTHQPAGSGGPVEIHVFFPAGVEDQVAAWTEAARGSLDVMGARVGPYPYETLTMVFGPWWAGPTFGMEYPTLFTADAGDPFWESGPMSGVPMNEATITHEFAHQYFQGMVASNEFEEAYLDEGLTEFWGYEIMATLYGDEGGMGRLFGRGLGVSAYESMTLPGGSMPEPVWSGPSYLTRRGSRFRQFYNVPAATMHTAGALFGRETVDRVFARYFERWAFGHPRFEDFLVVARETADDAFADFVLEAFSEHILPDYRVESLETEIWERPRGRLVTPTGIIEPVPRSRDAEESDEMALAGLDPVAREQEGRLVVEILDPGWTRGAARSPGGIERRAVEPGRGAPEADWQAEEGEFHVSTVRLEGSGWAHLPVEVRFLFADGATVEETWDGRARYRLYRFLRPAPLTEVRLDPEGKLALDTDPANNALAREADDELSNDWSRWLGGLFQLVLEGASQWL